MRTRFWIPGNPSRNVRGQLARVPPPSVDELGCPRLPIRVECLSPVQVRRTTDRRAALSDRGVYLSSARGDVEPGGEERTAETGRSPPPSSGHDGTRTRATWLTTKRVYLYTTRPYLFQDADRSSTHLHDCYTGSGRTRYSPDRSICRDARVVSRCGPSSGRQPFRLADHTGSRRSHRVVQEHETEPASSTSIHSCEILSRGSPYVRARVSLGSSQDLVLRTGFEPAPSCLKGRRPSCSRPKRTGP